MTSGGAEGGDLGAGGADSGRGPADSPSVAAAGGHRGGDGARNRRGERRGSGEGDGELSQGLVRLPLMRLGEGGRRGAGNVAHGKLPPIFPLYEASTFLIAS
jgi:hypothetical protein